MIKAKPALRLWSSLLFCLVLAASRLGIAAERAYTPMPPGLYVNTNDGTLMHDGSLYWGIGVNAFDAFYRHNTSYVPDFVYLHQQGIPFIRFMAAPGFWPSDYQQYLLHKAAYFARMDAFVHSAEEHHIGLIPSLFWNTTAVSDLMGEPRNQWANPSSKTMAFMRRYTSEVVRRYKDSPAIWGWEFGNEMNSVDTDLLNQSAAWRPVVNVAQGTPPYRTAADDLTTAQLRVALADFAKTVRRYDPSRIIISGNNIVGNNQYHRAMRRRWSRDTAQEYGEIMAAQNPDPVDTFSVHLYPNDEGRYFSDHPSTYRDLIAVSLSAADAHKKPLFIGEFGAPATMGARTARAHFEALLNAIVDLRVPLSALWVYDFSFQDANWNVTPRNARAYQLDDIAAANRRLRARMSKHRLLSHQPDSTHATERSPTGRP